MLLVMWKLRAQGREKVPDVTTIPSANCSQKIVPTSLLAFVSTAFRVTTKINHGYHKHSFSKFLKNKMPKK